MRRTLLWLAAAGALAALAFGGPLAAQDDVGISYDQVERVLSADAAVPGPDAFALDEEEARAASAPSPANKRGLARLLPADRRGSAGALAALTDDLRALGYPRVERHVFYHGWERVENLATGIVVLRKCDQGTIVTLDPERKTYRIEEPLAADRARLLQRAAQQRPGGAMLDVVRRVDPAGGSTIAGIAASAYQSTETLRVSGATGSCRATTVSAQTQTHYAPFAAPATRCARAAPDFPASTLAVVARDGCRPSVSAHASGATEPSAPLVLYRLMTLTEGRDRLALLTARGNIRSVVNPAPLFEIPPGYTKT
jgi:hypothetical protein